MSTRYESCLKALNQAHAEARKGEQADRKAKSHKASAKQKDKDKAAAAAAAVAAAAAQGDPPWKEKLAAHDLASQRAKAALDGARDAERRHDTTLQRAEEAATHASNRAFRVLSLKWHPDRAGDQFRPQFEALTRAAAVMRHAPARRKYVEEMVTISETLAPEQLHPMHVQWMSRNGYQCGPDGEGTAAAAAAAATSASASASAAAFWAASRPPPANGEVDNLLLSLASASARRSRKPRGALDGLISSAFRPMPAWNALGAAFT